MIWLHTFEKMIFIHFDHIVNPTVLDLYIHLERAIFHTTEFFFTFSHFHEHGLRHFNSLKYPGFLPTQADLLFSKNYCPVDRWTWNGNIFDDGLILLLILPSSIFIALPLFLNHHRCLFILQSERDWCVSSCSECFQYWVRFDGDHSIDLHRKLVGWFLYGIYRFYLVCFRWIVSLP